jgi:hypothetical protein
VIKISQLIENHKITVKRETNTIRYTEQRKLKLSQTDLSQLKITEGEVGFTVNVPFALPPEVTMCCSVELPVTNE